MLGTRSEDGEEEEAATNGMYRLWECRGTACQGWRQKKINTSVATVLSVR